MKRIKLFGLIAAVSVMAVACNDEEEQDTTAPVIREATIDGEDHDIKVAAGDEMHLDVHVTDNEALGELKMDVHDMFDGHSHKSAVDWSEVKTVQLSGKEQHVHEHMDVPQNATAGPYHVVFRLIDEEGNEGDFVELDFMITNASQPVINITSPDFSNHVDITRGSTLSIVGTITDDTDLDEIVVVLEEEHDDDHNHKSDEGEIFEADFDLPGSNDTSWDFQTDGNINIAIPADAETGDYVLAVVVEDNEGNINIFEGEVHIL
jgi:uncharacterized membrane protein